MNRWQSTAAILGLAVGVSGGAWAQQWSYPNHHRDYQRGQYGWQDRDHDGDRDDNGGVYGQRDRHRNDHDRDDVNRNGRYGAYSNMRNQAYRTGYQDGVNDGRLDVNARRNFQPEKKGNYKHADRGYNSSFGDKNGYKQVYRDGFLQGYRAGYGNGRYGNWGYGNGGRRY